MDVDDCHRDRCASRDHPVFVHDGLFGKPGVARGNAIGESDPFPDTGAEVRQLLQLQQVGRCRRVGQGFAELVPQSFVDSRLADDVETCGGERPRGRHQAGSYDQLRFVSETTGCLFLRWQVALEHFVEDCGTRGLLVTVVFFAGEARDDGFQILLKGSVAVQTNALHEESHTLQLQEYAQWRVHSSQ